MIHNKFRYLLTLVALFAISTGAWADETPLVTIESKDYTSFTSGSKTFDNIATVTFGSEVSNYGDGDGWTSVFGVTLTVTPVEGITITRVKFTCAEGSAFDETAPFEAVLGEGDPWNNPYIFVNGNKCGENGVTKIEVYGYAGSPIDVFPGSSANTWTFSMPGSDVEIAPIYAPVAQWAKDGDNVLVPKNIEGIIAGEDKPIVTEGTVATTTYGEGSDAKNVAQGTVMYFATTEDISIEQALASDGWVSTVPTAKGFDDYKKIVYVYYYIKGMDTPQGETATDKNTFNDSKAVYTKVQLLNNQFNLTLSPAPVEKVSVTIDGTAATPDQEGKIEAVKMNKEVKMTAKEGYKFRKVEVKKTMKLLTLTIGDVTIYYAEGDSWANAISRDENKDSGLFIREGNRVHHSNYGQLVDSNTQPVLPDAKINANESYKFVK